MGGITSLVRRSPVVAFFVLAYAGTWVLAPLLTISLLFGLLGLLVPGIAAVVVTAATDGRVGVSALLRRLVLWRVALPWYAVALGLPVLLSAVIAEASALLGMPTAIQISPISVLTLVVFVLVVGEEIGWRGYALPHLLVGRPALSASVILGILWGGWHLPLFLIPGAPQYGIPFPAFLLWVTALVVLFTWLYNHTNGSLLLATLFHGSVNSLGIFNTALDLGQRWWLQAGVYAAAALIVVLVMGPGLARTPRPNVDIVPEPAGGH